MSHQENTSRMEKSRITIAEQNRQIDELCKKYGPEIIEKYEENGITITRYSAR